jgi:autotransporter-associated beta strand protein
LTTTNYEYIGKSGVGIFTHTGGTNSISQYYLYLGYNAGSSGTYNLSGTGKLSAEYAYVGNSGSGIFTQTGGTNSIINNLYIGYNPSSIGTYNLSAGTNSSGSLYLGYYSGSNGTYYLNGTGQLTVIGNEYIGYTGTGIFSQTGGTNHIYGELYLCTNPGSIGTYNLNGGTLILYSLSQGSDTTVFNFGGGTLQVSSSFTSSLPIILTGDGGNANIDTAGYAVTLSGPLSGSGGLNKLDSGTLTLSGSNSYNGNTFIKAGKLSLSSTGSIGSTPIIDILSGATFDVSAKNGFTLGGMQSLMGRGTVLGGVVATPGSQIVPGDSAGILTISGNLTLNSGALLDFELANTSASDKISMTGSTLYLNNQQFSDFVFTPLGGFGAGTYILIDAGGIQGNLGNSLSGNIGGLPASLSTSGNDLVLNVVPEPSIWILLATAGLALFAYVRRQ